MTDSKGRLVAREPLCLFLVTSASWRLRGVKRPPNKEATESHREPRPANAGALSVKGNEAKPRVFRQNENPARVCVRHEQPVVSGARIALLGPVALGAGSPPTT